MSQHWYNKKAEACHTQITKTGKNKGKERNTTLADARRKHLFPSVSAYLAEWAIDLVRYNVMHHLEAAYAQPPIGSERFEDWARHIGKTASEVMGRPRKRGSILHGEVEDHFTSETGVIGPNYEYVRKCIDAIESHTSPVAHAEKVLVCAEHGYGGTADIIYESGAIDDIKTKDTAGGKEPSVYLTYPMQMASYFYAHNGHTDFLPCRTLFVSRDEPDFLKIKEWTPKELGEAWEAFQLCLGLYRYRTGYDARQSNGRAET